MNRFSDISNRLNLSGWRLLAVVASCGLLTGIVCGCSDGALGGGGSTTPTVRVVAVAGDGEAAGPEEVVEVAGYGTLTGRVILQGNMPSIPSILPAGELKDPEVCDRPRIPNESLVVDEATNGIQNVFVFLARKPPGTPAELAEPPETSIIFDQKVCTFLPHALVLRAGQEMLVLNSDAIIHNTHTKPQSNGEFNQESAAMKQMAFRWSTTVRRECRSEWCVISIPGCWRGTCRSIIPMAPSARRMGHLRSQTSPPVHTAFPFIMKGKS